MTCFPLFMKLEGRTVLICGGGAHALEKIERLKPFHPVFRVISAKIDPSLRQTDGLSVEERAFEESDLACDPAFVIAAEAQEENRRIFELCRRHRILVNAVDQTDACDFIFPSLFSSGDLCIGVSTDGQSPTAAVLLREQIAALVPDHIDEILGWMPAVRALVRERIPDRAAFKAALRAVVQTAFEKDRILTPAELEACMASF